MFLLRLAAAACATALPLVLTNIGLAGGGVFVPAQRHLVDPNQKADVLVVQKSVVPVVQQHVPVPVQKYAVAPVQHPLPFAVQKHAPQMHAYQKHLVAMPAPKIHYRHHGCQKRKGGCCCQLPYQVVLPVVDPKCGQVVPIPVTVPASCMHVPWQKDRGGLFCRGVSTFVWPCGYKVKVVLLHKGDAVVHTYGQRVHATAIPVALPVQSYPVERAAYPPPIEYAPERPADYAPIPAPVPTPALPPQTNGPELVPAGGFAF